MKNKKKKAFTLVELLAVIVILAVILVIAIPQIMKVIKASRINSIKSTAKIILRKGEEKLVENEVLGTSETLICNELTKMNSDYGSCAISYDENNKLNIRIKGKENGKFSGIICEGNIDNIECSEDNKTGATFLTGKEVNIKMKQLAGNDTTENGHNTVDTNITAIKRLEAEPEESNKEEKNIVSISESPYPIYMWYQDGTIYWWSEDKYPYLNEDASCMFRYLSNLVDISGLSNFDTSKVTSMRVMFASSSVASPMQIESLKSLKNWNTSKVTDMSGMFQLNASLTSLEGLENWDTSNVTNMMAMFSRCSNLINLRSLKKWNVSKVTTMYNMFAACLNLEEIDLSTWTTSSLENMTNMFGMWADNGYSTNVSKLKRIILSDKFDTSNVTEMIHPFANLVLLEDYDFVKYIDTSSVTSIERLFLNNSNMKEIDLSNWDLSNISSDSSIYMFIGCNNLQKLKTPKAYPSDSNVKITLPVTLKDSNGNSYNTLNNTSPTNTWLTK